MDNFEWQKLSIFLQKDRDRGYFFFPNLTVYLRVTKRYIQGQIVFTVDIVNVSVEVTGQGTFTSWMARFEKLVEPTNKTIYVENVLTDKFAFFWEKRGGYQLVSEADPADRCYFRLPMQKIA